MEDVKWMMELKTIIHFLFTNLRHAEIYFSIYDAK